MTDMAITDGGRSIDLTSEAARKRTKRRYRAEARFRAYGIGAIVFALAFLVFLIGDILIKAIPAFTVTSLDLTLEIDRESIDPTGSRDPAVIAAGDFMAPIRAALLEEFPGVAEDRRARQALYGLVS